MKILHEYKYRYTWIYVSNRTALTRRRITQTQFLLVGLYDFHSLWIFCEFDVETCIYENVEWADETVEWAESWCTIKEIHWNLIFDETKESRKTLLMLVHKSTLPT